MADRYRKRPVEITAVRNTGDWAPIIKFLTEHGAHRVPLGGHPPITRNDDGTLNIHTLEGVMRAEVGDWIVRGIKGEMYPVKPGIFAETYAPATDPDDLDDDEAAQLGADAYDLDIAAAVLRRFADLIDTGPAAPSTSLPPSVYSTLARKNADEAEQKAERLRARIPALDGGHCEVIDVDGQDVRVQAEPDLPDDAREALAALVRAVQAGHTDSTEDPA